MTKTIAAPSPQRILALCRAIRKTWSEREERRRRELATQKQQRLVEILFSKGHSSGTRVA